MTVQQPVGDGEGPAQPPNRPTRDPAQRELPLSAPAPVRLEAFADKPWQIEACWRIFLDTLVVSASLAADRFSEWFSQYLGFEHMPSAEATMHRVFRWSVVIMGFAMAFFDLLRFLYRRTPDSWKRRLGLLGK